MNKSDPNGHAPNKAGAADPSDIEGDIANIEGNNAKNFGKNNKSKAVQNDTLNQLEKMKISNKNRYFYTDKYGWVDARHFAKAANLTNSGYSVAVVESLGFINEIFQALDEAKRTKSRGKPQYRSAFSSEDLPSNRAGAEFGDSIGKNENVADAFSRWSKQAGARTKADPKSGYKGLPSLDPSDPQNQQPGWHSNISNNVTSTAFRASN